MGFNPKAVAFLPISGWHGDNMLEQSDNVSIVMLRFTPGCDCLILDALVVKTWLGLGKERG